MGGIGSGRRSGGGKRTTRDCWALDIRRIQRDGLLTPGKAFAWNWCVNGETAASIQVRTESHRLTLSYRHKTHGGDWQTVEYPVHLDWTACTFGGRRAWFLCPANGCRKRVALLYLGGGEIFACRHCYQLAYACQHATSAGNRAMMQADKIRARLGWRAGIAFPPGGKPKGMHWRTFERLKAKHDAFVGGSLAGIAQWLARRR